MKLSFSPQAIFLAMAAIMAQPGYPYAGGVKDLYKYDKERILNEFVPGARYLWVVSAKGTELTRIGVHSKTNEWANATIICALTSSSLGAEIYLVSDFGVRKISESQAKTELAHMDYVVDGRSVHDTNGRLLAVFEVRRHFKAGDGNNYAHVTFETKDPERLTKSDLLALRSIATSEAVLAAQSFFVKIETLTINGRCITEMIAPPEKTTALPMETTDAATRCA
ncbi:hypothetical protein Rfer_4303 (plasmid) [Rhodoferax ferrireducens T118]|uniref:Uncharacterized protein n=2 Tax=Rhodoferax ferrireducens TaxID=192843 RepID=Q21QF6_ALBFT|nr:hypothetical protein Rfer_4303 [Rhodoferax ferrireducens T118]